MDLSKCNLKEFIVVVFFFVSAGGSLFSPFSQPLAHALSLLMGSIRRFKQQPAGALPQLVVTDCRARPISQTRLTLPHLLSLL